MTDRVADPTKGSTDGQGYTSTGIAGLDVVLNGGLPPDHLFLIEGSPGSGKTTLALQFLLEGAKHGEPVLYITLAETGHELRDIARSHHWDLTGIDVLELTPPDEILNPETQYTVFHPADVELGQTMRSIYEAVERYRPRRLVIDSLSEMRVLAQESLRLRRQVLALKQFFLGHRCTVLLLDDLPSQDNELQFASIAHGVLVLEQRGLDYGVDRRRMRVMKLRGRRYRGGYHDFAILPGGLQVYPRLRAADYELSDASGVLSSGAPSLDRLLGGGIDRATSTLLVGPAGIGKSVLTTQFALAAAERGERAAIYLFDEHLRTFLARARGLGMDVESQIASGMLHVQQLDPAEMTPGQFGHMVVDAIERRGVTLVGVDSLTGYMSAMMDERLLTIHLHELLSFLTQRGVTSLVTLAQHGPFAGDGASAEVSYIADGIILLRYFEAAGQVRQAISIIKARSRAHEHSIREYTIGQGGYQVGGPLVGFQGVLTGVPQYTGASAPLLDVPRLDVPRLSEPAPSA